MNTYLRPSIVLLLLLSLVTGLAYPLLTTAVAQVLFPAQASGSLILRDGKAVGSTLIGQSFSEPRYFWGRLSATGPMPYNAAASSGSNYGPLNPALLDAARTRLKALHDADPGNTTPVPVDLITASASGLDPEISVAAALYQRDRIAKARGLASERVQALIDGNKRHRWLGFFGEPRVNVLKLNLALDKLRS